MAGWLDGCGVMLTNSGHSDSSSHVGLRLLVVVVVVVVIIVVVVVDVVVSYELKLFRRI